MSKKAKTDQQVLAMALRDIRGNGLRGDDTVIASLLLWYYRKGFVDGLESALKTINPKGR